MTVEEWRAQQRQPSDGHKAIHGEMGELRCSSTGVMSHDGRMAGTAVKRGKLTGEADSGTQQAIVPGYGDDAVWISGLGLIRWD